MSAETPEVPQSLQDKVKDTLLKSPLDLGVIEETRYGTRGSIGEDMLDYVDVDASIYEGVMMQTVPLSRTFLHVYRKTPIKTLADFQILYLQTLKLLKPFQSDIVEIEETMQPRGSYDEEDPDPEQIPDLNLGCISILDHPLPSLASLISVVVHPNEDIATRFAQAGADSDILELTAEFTIPSHELGEFLYPARPDDSYLPTKHQNKRRSVIGSFLRSWLDGIRRV